MHGDEINYITQPGAVGQIPYDAGQQERTRSQDTVVVSRRAQEIVEDCQRRGYRQHHKKPASKTSTFLQLAEGNTAILCIDQIKEAADDSSIMSEAQRTHGPRLGRLVDHVEAEACKQVTRAPAKAG